MKPPVADGYEGTKYGFYAPDKTIDNAEWSSPVSPEDTAASPVLMRIGAGDTTITVENVGKVGSGACDAKTIAVFKLTTVAEALDQNAVEPVF